MVENIEKQSNYSCDVLIIGGSAGLRAAIEAHDAGSDVLIISKSKRGDPHTTLAVFSANLCTLSGNKMMVTDKNTTECVNSLSIYFIPSERSCQK